MKRKRTALMCALLLLIGLSGCGSLAKNEDQPQYSEDQFVGFFVTDEQTAGWEDWRAAADERGKLWAEVNGMEVTFPLPGIPVYCATFTEMRDGELYQTAGSGAHQVANTTLSVAADDNGETYRLEGVLQVTASESGRVFSMNRMYQTGDGRIYAGTGNSFHGIGYYEGDTWTVRESEETAVTVNGETSTRRLEISLTLRNVFPISGYTLVQMDENHQLLERTAYLPGMLPEETVLRPGCDYVLLERSRTSLDGEVLISREVFDPEDQRIGALYDRGDGICVWQYTRLVWNGQ